MTEVEELKAEVERLKRDCPFQAELFKKTDMNQLGHYYRCSGCAVQRVRVLEEEVALARAALKGLSQLREKYASTERSREALEKVLLDLAPFVAALSRAPNVSPDARRQLLDIEPRMLDALMKQPKKDSL